jgi:glycosyltransferase involved in cell wall biosynthesis
MIKLVFVITGLNVGGAELILANLLTRLDRQKFDPLVVSLTGAGTVGEEIRRNGTRVIALDIHWNPLSIGSGLWRLFRLLRNEQPQLVLSSLYHADFAGLIAGRLAGVPRIGWSLHSAKPMAGERCFFTRLLIRLLAKLAPFPDFIIAVSDRVRDDHEKIGFHPKYWVIIQNGIDEELFCPDQNARNELRQELGLPFNTPLIGLYARFDSIKDHGSFIEAASIARSKRSDIHFVLAGYGVLAADLANKIQARNLQNCIHILGVRRDMPKLTSALDVAACTSRSESFCLSICEAMSCCVPCVVTEVDELPQLVSGAGLVVPVGQSDAMASAWLRILSMSKSTSLAMGQLGRKKVIDNYSLALMVARYERCIMDAVSNQSANEIG